VSDAFLVPLNCTALSRDFHKPVTVQTLARFDPELELLRNRQDARFEVHRRCYRLRRLWLGDKRGYLSFVEPMMIYVCDVVAASLDGFDDPTILIKLLEAGDVRRNPRLNEDREEAVRVQRYKIGSKVRDNYMHAFRSNWRQLLRAWEPLVNQPTLVR
jgi:hypothetical protein